MQIVQTLNDFIKILYTPSLENLCLGDFLLVQEAAQRYLGQVVELEDDKFDESKNLAKIKMTHSIDEDGNIVEFNNSTPSKHCEILYANLREIIDFTNENRKTVKFGEEFKYSKPFEINIDFFNENALIFCDSIKEHNHFSTHLAKKLSKFKNVILFDYTGGLEIDGLNGAQKFRAGFDFKLPLDYYSLDYIWQKGLYNATLETQVVCEEIFNEVKAYSRVAKDKFIPFNKFLKVIQKQYKATPIHELKLLKNRLLNYQQEELFANVKTEFTKMFEQINKTKITIIDLSTLNVDWHRDFTEFILRNIKINSYIFTRLNDANFDHNLIKLFYEKDRKYSVIPSISHTFSKLPAVCEYCQNFIILPTPALKKDFGCFNSTINAMANDVAMFYGKETKSFAFLVKNIEKDHDSKKTPKKPAYKVTFEGDVIKNIRAKDKLTQLNKKKIEEIEKQVDEFISQGATFEKQESEERLIRPADPVQFEEQLEEQYKNAFEALNDVEFQDINSSEDLGFDKIVTPKIEQGNPTEDATDAAYEFAEPVDYTPDDSADEFLSDVLEAEPVATIEAAQETIEQQTPSGFQIEEIISEEELDLIDAVYNDVQIEENPATPQVQTTPEELAFDAILESGFEDKSADEIVEEIFTEVETTETPAVEPPFEHVENEIENIIEEIEIAIPDAAIPDAALDNSLTDSIDNDDSFSLEELATNSIETAFDEMVQITFEDKKGEGQIAQPELEITSIERVKKQESLAAEFIEEIPIYTQDEPHDTMQAGDNIKSAGINADIGVKFVQGDTVFHDKYGEGKVLQVVEYADKVLLQIEFEQIGKRLLDPGVAGIKKI